MAKQKVKVLLNVGTDHQKQYGIPNSPDGDFPPREGDVISVDERLADILVSTLKLAKTFDAKEEKAHDAEVLASDVEAVRPEVEARLAREAAEKTAEKEAKKR